MRALNWYLDFSIWCFPLVPSSRFGMFLGSLQAQPQRHRQIQAVASTVEAPAKIAFQPRVRISAVTHRLRLLRNYACNQKP